jgi:hypothetical protein
VCVCAKVLLWRLLGKRCHISNPCIGIPHFRKLFDCPSYMMGLLRCACSPYLCQYKFPLQSVCWT